MDDKAFWIGFASVAVYVWEQGASLPRIKRFTQVVMSMGMGYGAAKGQIFGDWNPLLVAVTVTAIGPAALDTLMGLAKDRSAVIGLVKETVTGIFKLRTGK